MIELEQTYDGLSESEIQQIEARLGYEFPSDFWEFLESENGGRTPDGVFVFFVGGYAKIQLGQFLGFNGLKYDDIDAVRKSCWYIADCLLPVGIDTGAGEIFVMDLRPAELGKIYIRAHDVEPNREPSLPPELFDYDDQEASLYHPVADSFSAFRSGKWAAHSS